MENRNGIAVDATPTATGTAERKATPSDPIPRSTATPEEACEGLPI